MKFFALVNDGTEPTAALEIKEKININPSVEKNVLEFTSENKLSLQSTRRLLMAVTRTKDLLNLDFHDLDASIFTDNTHFKISIEGLSGQENRLNAAKILAEKLFRFLSPVNPVLDLKQPKLLVVAFYNGTEYFVGIDNSIREVNNRGYRVFPHSASFKGDLAYHLIRLSGFSPNHKLLIGFCKDAALAIEAGQFAQQKIFAFDERSTNVTAARKNVKISKTEVEVKKCFLEDLDINFNESYFDFCIFHVTSKDEKRLNEMYHQINYILKPGGIMQFIGRPGWELFVSDKFSLLDKIFVQKGDNGYNVWLMKKK